jgi:hypothetical protein
LKAYYSGKRNIDAKADVKKLASAAKAESDQAAEWLLAILAQSVKDEKSGDAPWQATVFRGRRPEPGAGSAHVDRYRAEPIRCDARRLASPALVLQG